MKISKRKTQKIEVAYEGAKFIFAYPSANQQLDLFTRMKENGLGSALSLVFASLEKVEGLTDEEDGEIRASDIYEKGEVLLEVEDAAAILNLYFEAFQKAKNPEEKKS